MPHQPLLTLVVNMFDICRVLEHIGASQLASHVRTFSDFLISEFSGGDGGDHVKV